MGVTYKVNNRRFCWVFLSDRLWWY